MSDTALVHVVLLRFAATATDGQRETFLAGLDEVLRRDEGCLDYRFGLDAGVAPDDDHYDFALTVAFPEPKDYLAYESSATHDEFVRRCAAPIVVGRATVQHWWATR
jgi:Stress responsive A/B Barrel Domain